MCPNLLDFKAINYSISVSIKYFLNNQNVHILSFIFCLYSVCKTDCIFFLCIKIIKQLRYRKKQKAKHKTPPKQHKKPQTKQNKKDH